MRAFAVTLLLAAFSAVAAARPGRMLLVGGLPQEAHGPNELHNPNLHGHNPTYTVEGTDVTVVNTNSARVNGDGNGGSSTGGAVLANSVQDIARSGSTYDITGTFRRQEALERADSSLRSATMSQNAQAQIMLAAGEQTAAAIGAYNDQAFGTTSVTTRGAGVDVGSPENRATLASQDAAAAVQMVTRGQSTNTRLATQAAHTAATSTQVDRSHWYVFVPTWW